MHCRHRPMCVYMCLSRMYECDPSQPKLSPEEHDERNTVDILPLVASLASTFEGGVGLSDFLSLETLPLFECLLDALVCRVL